MTKQQLNSLGIVTPEYLLQFFLGLGRLFLFIDLNVGCFKLVAAVAVF
jgi:hypothetical protein